MFGVCKLPQKSNLNSLDLCVATVSTPFALALLLQLSQHFLLFGRQNAKKQLMLLGSCQSLLSKQGAKLISQVLELRLIGICLNGRTQGQARFGNSYTLLLNFRFL